MSGSITTNKSSFVIFGHGFNDSRADSGDGTQERIIPLSIRANYAEFDITGRYCWLALNNGSLAKYDTSTWTAVTHSLPTNCNWIDKPKNTNLNYGVTKVTNSNLMYVFDLTTDEIIATGECSLYTPNTYYCILDGDKLRFSVHAGAIEILSVDVDDFSVASSGVISNRVNCGFHDGNSVYAFYPKAWYSQLSSIYSYNSSGGTDWSLSETYAGSFDNMAGLRGLVTDGYIYVPTIVGEKYRIGKYGASSAPDFNNPNPISYIGDTTEDLSLTTAKPIYSAEKKMCTFATESGMYITDFKNRLSRLNTDPNYSYTALAMSKNMVFCTKGQASEVFVF